MEIRDGRHRHFMKRIGILVALILVAIVTYRTVYPSVTLRYRLTLDVEINGSLKSSSGVIEITYSKNPQLLGASAAMTTAVVGQAVWVDLGERDALFALLTAGRHPRSAPAYIIPVLFGATPDSFGPEDFGRIGALSGQREIPFELLPLMVRLRDVNDPRSAELFESGGASDASGRGLKLVRATIEIVPSGIWPLNDFGVTGVPISRGIEAKLPWLLSFKGLSGGQSNIDRQRPEKNLTGNDFIKGSVR
jgi:hypothetical protein